MVGGRLPETPCQQYFIPPIVYSLLSFLSLCLECLPLSLPDQSVCEFKVFHFSKVQIIGITIFPLCGLIKWPFL